MADSDEVGNFGVWDYVVFGGMLCISLAIGFFYGCTGDKQKTTKEFLLADRSMNPIPVAMSLVASFISAVTVLGTPAEVYINGTMFWLFALVYPIMAIVVSRLFIPVFFRLNVTSANEYLEKRFNKVVRVSGTFTLFLNMVMYLGIVIYTPGLALNAVTGLNLWGSVLVTGLVCTIYTAVGGMKAVLWTDVFQTCIMMAGFLAVIIEGSNRVGGLGNVWKIAEEGQRIDFWNFNFDPTIRHTFWSIVIGGTFTWLATYGVNQSQVQRYMTTKTMKRARISLFLAAFGMMVVVSCACFSGLVMYSFYAKKQCDPYTSNKVSKTDQLVPYFMLELFGSIPGLPGLFTSAIFSAALSTISSGLNSLAAVTAEDLVRPCFPRMNQARYTLVTKGIACGFGLLCILMAFITSLLNQGVLQLVISLFGITGGPLLGIFSLGLFFPWSNSKGAITGLICGLAFGFWVGFGAIAYPPSSYKPPLIITGCNLTTTTSAPLMTTMVETAPPVLERPPIVDLYSLSYTWYTCAYWLVTVLVGISVSFLTGIVLNIQMHTHLVFNFLGKIYFVTGGACIIPIRLGATKGKNTDPLLMEHCVDGCYCCLPELVKKPLRCGATKLVYREDGDEDTMFHVVNCDEVAIAADAKSHGGITPNTKGLADADNIDTVI